MQCFTLPYGSIGFVLDLLVVYGTYSISCGCSPWKGEKIEHHLMNIYFSFIGLSGSVAIAIYNATLCNDHRPLALVSIWKGTYVGFYNLISMTSHWKSYKSTEPIDNNITFVLIAYTLSGIFGLIGLGNIAREGWDDRNMKIGMLEDVMQSIQTDALDKFPPLLSSLSLPSLFVLVL
jgi:hypothetical protein